MIRCARYDSGTVSSRIDSPAAIRWNAWSIRSRCRACISFRSVRTAASDPGECRIANSRSTAASRVRSAGDARAAISRHRSAGSTRYCSTRASTPLTLRPARHPGRSARSTPSAPRHRAGKAGPVPGGDRRLPPSSSSGRPKSGPRPVDRARPGSKHHVISDAHGTPLAITLTGGNRHGVTQLLPLLDAISRGRGATGRPHHRPRQPFARPGLRLRQVPPPAAEARYRAGHRPPRRAARLRPGHSSQHPRQGEFNLISPRSPPRGRWPGQGCSTSPRSARTSTRRVR
ncbi:DDE family transposase [Streptomyces sp. TLI_171]|nr:DDE family transposase [Streptomyces sp. TLI_171]